MGVWGEFIFRLLNFSEWVINTPLPRRLSNFFKQTVTVKTPFDCIKTNKQTETQEWVFVVIFRSPESFVDPLAKEKLTWNANGWLASQDCATSPCPMPVPATQFLLTLCYPGPGVNTSARKHVLWARLGGLSGLKNNLAKYVCLSLCVHVWKQAQFPCMIHGKAVPRSVLARGQAGAKGEMEQPQELGRKISLTDIAVKYCIFWSHCLRPEQ